MGVSVFDRRVCALGEGPLWHPGLNTLFWFDILGRKLLSRAGETAREWELPELTSAAAWVDEGRLVLSSETGLHLFEIADGAQSLLCEIEAERGETRSNDGRADPWGGFWISTMGKSAEEGAGAIYRWYRNELRIVREGVTIPNAICFSPDRRLGYFADSAQAVVFSVEFDAEDGWPRGEPRVFLDFSGQGVDPDGAVTDAEGCVWIALWGGGCVAKFSPDGRELARFDAKALQPTCPAFGGADFADLLVTSATQGLDGADGATALDGQTFCFSGVAKGRAEPAVRIGG